MNITFFWHARYNYNDLRKQYFKPSFCHWPTKQKSTTLITSTNNSTLLNVSKYIFYAFWLRSSNTLLPLIL